MWWEVRPAIFHICFHSRFHHFIIILFGRRKNNVERVSGTYTKHNNHIQLHISFGTGSRTEKERKYYGFRMIYGRSICIQIELFSCRGHSWDSPDWLFSVHSAIGMDGNDEKCDAHGLQFSDSSNTSNVGEKHSVRIKSTHQEATMGQHASRIRIHFAYAGIEYRVNWFLHTRRILYTRSKFYRYDMCKTFYFFLLSRSFSISFGFALTLLL